MKTAFLLISLLLLSFDKPKIRHCKVKITNSENGRVDTIYLKAHCGLCIVTFVNDSIPKLVDGRGYIYRDSVSDFEVLEMSNKRINNKTLI